MPEPKYPIRDRTASKDYTDGVHLVVRPSGITGPPLPKPFKNAPHQDLGILIDGFLGDIQGVGGGICNALDKPLEMAHIKFPGPHRLVDDFATKVTGILRYSIQESTR